MAEFRDTLEVGAMVRENRLGKASYALGVWIATLQAARLGIEQLKIFEFGVATGKGLFSLCEICRVMHESTGMEYEIFGFDSAEGMPALTGGYRDHPEIWFEGQFKHDHDAIRVQLPSNARLVSGQIKDTLPAFCAEHLNHESPVGFVAVDVDLYSSTVEVFKLFGSTDPEVYLPVTVAYFDDINDLLTNNAWCGEMLAIREWNEVHELRKIEEMRVRQNHSPAGWHDHLYGYHVLDHPVRTGARTGVCLDINITAL